MKYMMPTVGEMVVAKKMYMTRLYMQNQLASSPLEIADFLSLSQTLAPEPLSTPSLLNTPFSTAPPTLTFDRVLAFFQRHPNEFTTQVTMHETLGLVSGIGGDNTVKDIVQTISVMDVVRILSTSSLFKDVLISDIVATNKLRSHSKLHLALEPPESVFGDEYKVPMLGNTRVIVAEKTLSVGQAVTRMLKKNGILVAVAEPVTLEFLGFLTHQDFARFLQMKLTKEDLPFRLEQCHVGDLLPEHINQDKFLLTLDMTVKQVKRIVYVYVSKCV
jgi:hypothetical protein